MAIKVKPTQRSVELAALPGYRQNVRDTTGEALGDVGQGIARLGQGAAALTQKIIEEQDRTAVRLAEAELAATKRTMLDGERDDATGELRHGLAQQQGQDALKNSKGFSENWRTEVDRVRGRLTPAQQERIQPSLDRESADFENSINRHLADQSKMLHQQGYKAAISSAKSSAIAAAARGEHDKVQGQIMRGLSAVAEMAEEEGWDKKFAAQQVRGFETETHLGVLEQMIGKGDAAGAAEYLDGARPYMDGAMVAESKIEKVIAAGQLDTNAEQLASQAWDAAMRDDKGNVVAAEGDPARAMGVLRSKGIKDQKLLDEALQRVQQRGSMETAARRQADAPLVGELEVEILGRGRFNRGSTSFARLSKQGQADVLRMEKAEQRSRREASNRERDMQSRLDAEAMADARAMASLYPEQFAQLDVTSRYPDATKRQRDLILEHKGKTIKEMRSGRAVPKSQFLADAKRDAKDRGLDGDKTNSLLSYLSNSYDAWLEDPANEKFKHPTQEWTRRAIGDALLYGEETGGKLWNTNMYQFEARSAGKGFTDEGFDDKNPKRQTAPPAPLPAPTLPDGVPVGSIRITDGKRNGWLHPGKTMPAGFKAAE